MEEDRHIEHHYDIERELGDRLRHAPEAERRSLYRSVYAELYRRLPEHPGLARHAWSADVEYQWMFVRRFVDETTTFLEIGSGDCALASLVARKARLVYALDACPVGSSRDSRPNVQVVTGDGCSIPLTSNSVHVAYSYQFIEHLHPDDASEHLREVHRVIVPGGVYVCVTPNRITGPHDISMHFDDVATGLHLQEYTVTSLAAALEAAGFRRVFSYLGARGRYLRCMLGPVVLCEKVLSSALRGRRPTLRNRIVRMLLNVRLAAVK